MFESLGLRGEAEATYLHLLRHGPATLNQLAAQLGQSADTLATVIDELRQFGLLHTTAQPGDLVVAVPLLMGADHLIAQRERELERLRHATRLLEAQLTHRGDRETLGPAELITDRDEAGRIIHRLQMTAHEGLRLLVRRPDSTSAALRDAVERNGPRGLRYQAIYDEASLTSTNRAMGLSNRFDGAVQVRLGVELPATAVIADRSSALITLDVDSSATEPALLVKGGALVRILDALFNALWLTATPLGPSGLPAAALPAAQPPPAMPDRTASSEASLDEQDHALLSLLVSGMTDDTAGSRLGISRRTVARRVQRLMTATGARSRMQLGWWARERGWL